MQIFIKHFLEQRPSQHRGVFAGKLISETDTPHANTTPTRTQAHTSRCHKTRGGSILPYTSHRGMCGPNIIIMFFIFYAVSVRNI